MSVSQANSVFESAHFTSVVLAASSGRRRLIDTRVVSEKQ
jgi:hypothetical protein